jgi:pimeloyl-ACP methyl ester carboxylesterase
MVSGSSRIFSTGTHFVLLYPTMSRTLYFISGLGADERVFQDLGLEGERKVFIRWSPHDSRDSLQEYARRLGEQIHGTDDTVLIGFSLGGMLAIELSRLIPVKKTIIVSCIKSRQELPLLYRCISRLTFLLRTFPHSPMRRFPFVLYYFMGAESSRERRLLDEYLRRTDEAFLHWAVEKILTWRSPSPPPDLVHIHGTSDRVFPASRIQDAVFVRGGSHLMLLSRAEEVSRCIREALDGK